MGLILLSDNKGRTSFKTFNSVMAAMTQHGFINMAIRYWQCRSYYHQSTNTTNIYILSFVIHTDRLNVTFFVT